MFAEADIRAARRAQAIAVHAARTNPRVQLVDVGIKWSRGAPTGELAVRVHLTAKPTGAAFERLRQDHPELVLDTGRIPYRTDVIEGRYRLHQLITAPGVQQLTQRHRPLIGGISIGNAWSTGYGTLGGIVVDADQIPMILGNWHVLVGSSYARPGLAVHQPAVIDTWRRDEPIAFLGADALAAGYDAALAPLVPAVTWSDEQLGLGPHARPSRPALDARVRKVGRGSGLTTGTVDGINGVFTYPYARRYRTITDVCTIVGGSDDPIARPGDSGAWWIDDAGAVSALHFAGQLQPPVALAMDMPQVFAALGVALPRR